MENKEFKYSNVWNQEEIDNAMRLPGPIFIVGASGFIGANLFYSLKKLRDDVFACSRDPFKSWRLNSADNKSFIGFDITNYEQTKKILADYRPRTVFNLSAYGAYSRQSDASLIHQTNYNGTLNLLRVLAEIGCDAFVQSGSSSEYGLNCTAPLEGDELIPNSDYAVSKVGSAYLIKYYGKILQFPCVNLRLYSVYGPFEEKDRLMPTLISNCLQGKLPDFAAKDVSRDFIYIDDCTAALVKAALTACKTNRGASINIGSGVKTSLQEVADIAKEIFSLKEEPKFGAMQNRKWDLSNWFGNPDLAKKILGWGYRTSLKDGLKLFAQWERETAEKFKYVTPLKTSEKISMIIACYKDNQAIPIMHERITKVFQNLGLDYEIIFVNDCSPLNDEEVINEIAKKDYHVIGISHSRNFGSQSAFLSGMQIASGDAVVLMDGDGQDPPEIIPSFVEKWHEGNEVVYGQRVKREAPFYMQMFYKLFYRIFKNVADINIPVDAGDFSLIDKKVVRHLLSFSEKDVFLRGLRAWVGFKQIGVPYVRPERLFGKSTNNFVKNIWWAKKAIFSFSIKPLQYIQTFGVVVFISSILLGLFYLVSYFLDPGAVPKGFATIIMISLGSSAVQIISISILGDYIGKIIEEVKNRPKFIRNKVIYNGQIYAREDKFTNFIKTINNDKY